MKELVETVRASGTEVELRITGTDRQLSPALELSLYRVVQEALTNVVKHAPGAAATVEVAISDDAVRVEVVDNGSPAGGQTGARAAAGPWDRRDARTGRRLRRLPRRPTVSRWRVPRRRRGADRGSSVTTKVLVVDDEALLRTAFTSLIEAEEDLRVVGEAADGKQAVELAARLSPDVVVMDVRMPGMDGIEATRRITAAGANAPRVLILTTFDLDEYVFDALRAGASGFALKSRPLDELLAAIRVVAAGEALLAPSVTRRLIAHFSHRDRRPAEGAPTSICSPSVSEKCWRSSRKACPTPRSPTAAREPPDGQDPREPHPFQARRPRPHPARRHRLRIGTRHDHLTAPRTWPQSSQRMTASVSRMTPIRSLRLTTGDPRSRTMGPCLTTALRRRPPVGPRHS